jgi:hypothetical protein
MLAYHVFGRLLGLIPSSTEKQNKNFLSDKVATHTFSLASEDK